MPLAQWTFGPGETEKVQAKACKERNSTEMNGLGVYWEESSTRMRAHSLSSSRH